MSSAIRRMGDDVTLDTVQGDVWHLFHLLDAIIDLLLEMDYERDGKRDHALDRIAALTWIARDEASFIGNSIDDNFHEIEGRPVRMTGGDRNG
ncbi:MAG: hypothetical protein WA975_04965 [Mesorhizobium sp.]